MYSTVPGTVPGPGMNECMYVRNVICNLFTFMYVLRVPSRVHVFLETTRQDSCACKAVAQVVF